VPDKPLIPNVGPEALQLLLQASKADPQARWACYVNMAMDSQLFGHHQFLAVGPTNTYKDPPKMYPADTKAGCGWRYRFVGYVDLSTGEVST